jgi:hypothetical protein
MDTTCSILKAADYQPDYLELNFVTRKLASPAKLSSLAGVISVAGFPLNLTNRREWCEKES